MEVGLNELNCKLAALTLEYNNKSRELFARQRGLDMNLLLFFFTSIVVFVAIIIY